MADVSIIEFIVYGLVGYTGIILLIASSFKELPATKTQSAVRSIWILAPIFCMYMLASAGANIILDSTVETATADYETLNSADVVVTLNSTTTTSTTNQITLLQPVWVTLHILFFIMLILYFIWNMLQLLVKRD